MNKSTVQEIRDRFDNDVERFSKLETGQVSTIDARLSLKIITAAAKRVCPAARNLLDIGCGAGNYTLEMLGKLPGLNCTLVDLSKPILDKALERVTPQTSGAVVAIQGDIREVALPSEHYDIILAGAVLHHLREDADWQRTFRKLFRLLKPGGCLLVSDLMIQDTAELTAYFWELYGEYLYNLNGAEYRDKVLAYVEKEDSPRSMTFQLDLLKRVGFSTVEVLHKHICFGAYCGIRR